MAAHESVGKGSLWVDSQQGTADNADVNLARKAKTKFFAKDNPIVIQCVRKSKWYHQCVVDYDEHGAPSTFDRETMLRSWGGWREKAHSLTYCTMGITIP